MVIFLFTFLTILVLIQTWRIILDGDLIDTQQRTISRMEVSEKNLRDREKQLLERIKYCENYYLNNKICKK